MDAITANIEITCAAQALASRRLELFARRCLDLSDQVAEHRIAFLDAIDIAYEAATWAGLVDEVGDDIVQFTMAAAFANARSPA